MNITQIRNKVKQQIDKLSTEKLIAVEDFLKELEEDEAVDATEELLNISGFESAFAKANREIKEGKVREWHAIRDDV